MHRSSRSALSNFIQLFLDISFLVIAYFISYAVISIYTPLDKINVYVWLIIIYPPFWALWMSSFQMYNVTTFVYFDRTLKNVVYASFIATMITASMMYFLKDYSYSRLLFGFYVVISSCLVLVERYLFSAFVKRRRNLTTGRVMLVGDPEKAEKFCYYVSRTNMLMNIVGFINVVNGESLQSYPNLGSLEDIEDILINNVVDEVVFLLPRGYTGTVEKYAKLCEEMGITVKIVINLYDLKNSRNYLSSVGVFPVLTYYSVNQSQLGRLVKRLMDIVGALVGLILSLPFAIFIIPAIKLDSPGPIFFGQQRVGRNGRRFKLYKFRSMCIDAEQRLEALMSKNKMGEGYMFKLDDDPRITRVGRILRKTSLDELPQFFNVLRGDMSLVGTRPPTAHEVEKYKRHHYRRISMKPGLTGMWQVSGRSEITDFDEVVHLDTKYIDNWSIWLDIKIILKTVKVVLIRKGSA